MSLFAALSIDLVNDIEAVYPTYLRILTTEETLDFIIRQIFHSCGYIILPSREVRMCDYKYMGSDIIASRSTLLSDPSVAGNVYISIPLNRRLIGNQIERFDYSYMFRHKGLVEVREHFWKETLILFGLRQRQFKIDKDDQLHQVRMMIENMNSRFKDYEYGFSQRKNILEGTFFPSFNEFRYKKLGPRRFGKTYW